jgi:hypothetical protein
MASMGLDQMPLASRAHALVKLWLAGIDRDCGIDYADRIH